MASWPDPPRDNSQGGPAPPTLVIADQGQTALAVTPVTSAWATTHQRTEYPFLQNRRHDRHQAPIRLGGSHPA